MSTESSTLLEQRAAALVNSERQAAGLEDVEIELHLNSASQSHADWMAETGNFSHEGEAGSSVTDRAVDAAFPLEGDWRISENLAWISTSGDVDAGEVDALHQALMNSPGHRDNILDPDVSYIGVGIATGKREVDGVEQDAVYLTQAFAETEGDVLVEDVDPAALELTPQEEIVDDFTESSRSTSDDANSDDDDSSSDNAPCFVATAAYGDPSHPDVEALRAFRYEVLDKTILGRVCIRVYWTVGPILARAVTHTGLSGHIARVMIAPVVKVARHRRLTMQRDIL